MSLIAFTKERCRSWDILLFI